MRAQCVFAFVAGLLAPLAATAQTPLSPAAVGIVRGNILEACPDGGALSWEAVVSRDLTGDGVADLVVPHEQIACEGGAKQTCGLHSCALEFYVGLPDGGYRHDLSAINLLAEISDDPIPVIQVLGHNFAQSAIRWTGESFVHVN